jgi:hypothetical protein
MDQPKKPTPGASRSATKPAASKPQPKQPAKPGSGLMGWLGRQVGHVKKAVKTDVTKGAAAKPASGGQTRPAANPSHGSRPAGANFAAASRPSPASKPAATAETSHTTTAMEKVIYREDKVEEAELPDRPGVILRRTIIDEVVVETETKQADPNQG